MLSKTLAKGVASLPAILLLSKWDSDIRLFETLRDTAGNHPDDMICRANWLGRISALEDARDELREATVPDRAKAISAARELIRQLATEQIDPETAHTDLADLSNYIDDFMRPLMEKLP